MPEDRLHEAARDYGIAAADWVDLSGAVNREPYPVHPIDPSAWQRRSDDDEGLERAAADYYGNDRLIALPGPRAAIALVPTLFKPLTIACLPPVSEAHARAWEGAGHKLRRLPSLARALAAATPNILVSDASDHSVSADVLLAAADTLRGRGGFLIVDERFADAEAQASLAACAGGERAPNLIVLRSLDAFFGLAGARVAFVLAAPEKLERLRSIVGNDALAPPSRAVARQALTDAAWQASTRSALAQASQRLAQMLAPHGPVVRNALFCSLKLPQAALDALFDRLARRAILTRRLKTPASLRLALPRGEDEWQRLAAVLAQWTSPHA